ncbi:hypothetical protein Tco_0226227, partial [Tanacetum coccineum]
VMAAPLILILSDSSEESVGSHVPRVILFGTILTSILVIPVVPAEVPIAPADLLVAPEVGAVSVISPTRVLDLVDYSSSSDSDPSHESLTPSYEFPLAPVVSPPRIHRRPSILVRPGEAIPFGRPYRTHPNGPRKLLTARKRVGPFPARRLAWRRVSHHSSDRHSSPDFTSDSLFSDLSLDSSSSGSSSDSLSCSSSVHSLGCDTLGQSHSGPYTRVASPRSAPLSTFYPPTTSESSLDLSSERSLDSSLLSTRPSRKRYRPLTTLVPLSNPVPKSIASTHVDLLPPRKRFRDSYSSEDSREEHMEIGTADVEAVTGLGIGDGVGSHTEYRRSFIRFVGIVMILGGDLGGLDVGIKSLLKVTAVKISLLEDMFSESTYMVDASKVPIIKPEIGNSAPKTTVAEGVEKVIPPTTVEEKA